MAFVLSLSFIVTDFLIFMNGEMTDNIVQLWWSCVEGDRLSAWDLGLLHSVFIL
jgi:hypothetical protein